LTPSSEYTFAVTTSPTSFVPSSGPTSFAPSTGPLTFGPTGFLTLTPTGTYTITPAITSRGPTSMGATTMAPTTPGATTMAPTTPGATTMAPSTPGATTMAPTTMGATTMAPSTPGATTMAPTTMGATTMAPTTPGATTMAPTTRGPTSMGATTTASTLSPTTPVLINHGTNVDIPSVGQLIKKGSGNSIAHTDAILGKMTLTFNSKAGENYVGLSENPNIANPKVHDFMMYVSHKNQPIAIYEANNSFNSATDQFMVSNPNLPYLPITMIYDGTYVSYYINGELKKSTLRTSKKPLYGVFLLQDDKSFLYNISVVPAVIKPSPVITNAPVTTRVPTSESNRSTTPISTTSRSTTPVSTTRPSTTRPSTPVPLKANLPTFYTDLNYKGDYFQLPIGSHNVRDFRNYNDEISSIRVPKGITIVLYSENNFKGDKVIITHDENSLDKLHFNNMSSSIVVTDEVNAPTFYTNAKFQGESYQLPIGSYNMNDIRLMVYELSSIKIPTGFLVTLYSDKDFKGTSVILTETIDNLSTKNFNNKTLSITVSKIITQIQTTRAPTTQMATTRAPTTQIISSRIPSSEVISRVSTTSVPTTRVATTQGATTRGPTTQAPTTRGPTTQAPTTRGPTTPPVPVKSPTFYTDVNYRGTSFDLPAGNHNIRDLKASNDEISSIRIPKGYTVVLYSEPNFKGDKLIITHDVNNLNTLKFNNVTSSVVVATEVTAPTFYTDSNFVGESYQLPIGSYNTSDIRLLNDELSSIKIPNGFIVTLYSEKDFKGTNVVLNENTNKLSDKNFNNKSSSIVVAKLVPQTTPVLTTRVPTTRIPVSESVTQGPTTRVATTQAPTTRVDTTQPTTTRVATTQAPTTRVPTTQAPTTPYVPVKSPTFYTDINYRGTSFDLPAGNHNIRDLKNSNDEISSIRVPKGYSVVLYSEPNFKGDKLIVTHDEKNLNTVKFNNVTSSVVVATEVNAPTFYTDANFVGESYQLPIGSYNMSDIRLLNDELSSVKIPNGLVVTLYSDKNFKGNSVILTENSNNLSTQKFNNKTSSIVVSKVVPTTGVPTTGVPTTGVPTTGVPTTGVPTTGVPTTGVPTTRVPTTNVQGDKGVISNNFAFIGTFTHTNQSMYFPLGTIKVPDDYKEGSTALILFEPGGIINKGGEFAFGLSGANPTINEAFVAKIINTSGKYEIDNDDKDISPRRAPLGKPGDIITVGVKVSYMNRSITNPSLNIKITYEKSKNKEKNKEKFSNLKINYSDSIFYSADGEMHILN